MFRFYCILLSLLWLSFIWQAAADLSELKRFLDLEQDTLTDQVETVFQVTYNHISNLFQNSCLTKNDPFEVLFEIYCGVGGHPEAIGIAAEENLCDSTSITTNNPAGDRSNQFLTCRHYLTAPDIVVGAVGSEIIFSYKCVAEANLKGSDAALQTTVIVPEFTDIFCEDGALVQHSLSRILNVNYICNDLVSIGMQFPYFEGQGYCTGEGVTVSTDNSCMQYLPCFFGADCRNDMPALLATLQEDELPPSCIFPRNSFPISIQDRYTQTVLSEGQTNIFRVLYVVAISSYASGPCSIARLTKVTFRCGNGGQINKYEDEDDSKLQEEGCSRLSRDSIQCLIDVGETAEFDGKVETTCQGSTLESLVLEVDWDPDFMVCSAPDDLSMLSMGQTAHGLEVIQYCPSLDPWTDYVSYPYDRMVQQYGQECAEPSDNMRSAVPYDWIDINGDGQVFNYDGTVQENEIYTMTVESCVRRHFNCRGESLNYCDDDSGTQNYNYILRSRAALDSVVLDTQCLLPLAADFSVDAADTNGDLDPQNEADQPVFTSGSMESGCKCLVTACLILCLYWSVF